MKKKPNGHPSYQTKNPLSKILLTMKLTTLLLLVACLQVSAHVEAQRITYTRKNTSFETVFKAIRKQTGYEFLYNTAMLENLKLHNLELKNVPLENALDKIFNGKNLTYSILGKTIVVRKKEQSATPAPEKLMLMQVQGTVVDSATGQPLVGVTLKVKSSTMGTATDADGHFSLNIPEDAVLIVSYLGYTPKEVAVNGRSNLRIELSAAVTGLTQLVVVGYGVQEKESLTGSLDVIDDSQLKNVASPTVENMLNGKAPGVYVASGSGQPGSRASVRIRGQVTLSGSTSPLWVIDGVIVGKDAGDLNPDDIASISILKDAASTAIYGSQGANGVVLVTTKKPKDQALAVNLSTKIGFNELNNGNMQMMNGSELYDYYASFQNADVISFPRWNPDLRNSNFDWWNLATRKGLTQQYNLSLNGGNETLRNYLSLGYYNEKGAVKGYDYKKYNVRLNTVYKPLDWLTIKTTLSGAKRDVSDHQYSVTAMYSNLPWDSPYDKDGNLVPNRYSGWVNSAGTNYLYDLQWNHSANTNYQLMGIFGFDIRFTNWLTFSSVNSYRQNLYSSSGYVDPRSDAGLSVQGRISDYRSNNARRYTNQLLRFNKTWGKHHLKALAGYEFTDYRAKTLDVSGIGFIPGFEVLDVVSKPEKTDGGISEWAVQSMLSKASYDYDSRYLIEASFRRDGASNFGDNAKYGNFFSVSGGWNIFKEKWFSTDWVNNLKLRASYGSVGNRPSALYPQYDLYSVSSSYNESPGALISQIGNRDLTWEKTFTSGVGVDAGLFDDRLYFTFDYYVKNTKNILYRVPISGLTGVTSIWRNIGEMKNNGIELNIGGDIIRKDNLRWSVNVNLGHNKNELTKLYKTKDENGDFVVKPVIIGDGLGIAGSAQRLLLPGKPVDSYYLIEWAGVNPDNGAPMWYKITKDDEGHVVSKEKTENYSEATYTIVGSASPDIFGGFSTSLEYKNFDLNALFGYSVGGKIYNYSRQEYDADGAYTDRNQMKLMDGWSRWEKPGDIATHPVAKYNNTDHGNSPSSRYLENGSYLKLRSLTIGYNIALPKWKIKNARIFLSGQNLLTITKYSGVDPEIPVDSDGTILSSTGPGVYPAKRLFMFGLNVSF